MVASMRLFPVLVAALLVGACGERERGGDDGKKTQLVCKHDGTFRFLGLTAAHITGA